MDIRAKGGFGDNPQNINREGRPKKGETLTDALREYADKADVDFGEEKISRRDALSQKLWQMALGGDIQAMRYIYDRIDGKPVQSIHADIYQEENPLYEAIKELRSETEQETT